MKTTQLICAMTGVLALATWIVDSTSRVEGAQQEEGAEQEEGGQRRSRFLTEPLVRHVFTADPSAHVFDGKLYLYPSHDWESDIPSDDLGSQYDMKDYHVFSMDSVGGEVVDHGVVLHVDNVPWAQRQMWAPDATERDGTYYFYFPAKDQRGVFHIGAATSSSPTGPFTAQPEPIEGSYSMDPAIFRDDDGQYYMYLGGIWGGQLQRWATGQYVEDDVYPADNEPALAPKIARMSDDMLSFAEKPRDVLIVDDQGAAITAGDNARRFFEAAWVHRYNGKYYLSYSTGDTHFIAYAIGDNPYGPFTYQGVILQPVLGWTNHHSIVQFNGQWYLFYHDAEISGGQSHLRNVKATKLTHNSDGSIAPIDAYFD